MKAVLQLHSPRRRDRMHIIADIVGITIGGSLKTQVMYKANLSFAQVNEYLPFLLHVKLVAATITKGKKVYRATPKGTKFISSYTKINDLLKTEGKHTEENNSLIYTRNGNCYKTKE